MTHTKIHRPMFFEMGADAMRQLAAMMQRTDISFVPPQLTMHDQHAVEWYTTRVQAGLLRSVLEDGYGNSPLYIGLVLLDDPEGESSIIGTYLGREAAEQEAVRMDSSDFPTGVIETTPSLLRQNVAFYSPGTATQPNCVTYQIMNGYADAGVVCGPPPAMKYNEPGDCGQTSVSGWHDNLDHRETPIDRVYAKLVGTLMDVSLERVVAAERIQQVQEIQAQTGRGD